jgi:hypothetical protein
MSSKVKLEVLEGGFLKFTVGRRPLELSREQVLEAMDRVQPESIRKHAVKMGTRVYPPKQVLAVVTGWDRLSFTTMEAQRVLLRLGFACQRVDTLEDGRSAWGEAREGRPADESLVRRVSSLEAELGMVQVAIAGLHARVREIEAQR